MRTVKVFSNSEARLVGFCAAIEFVNDPGLYIIEKHVGGSDRYIIIEENSDEENLVLRLTAKGLYNIQ